MVSKHDAKGLGYYREAVTHEISLAEELIPLVGCETMRLRLDELMARTNGDEPGPPPTTAPGDVRTKAKRQRRKGNRTVLDDETDDLTWQCDGSLSTHNENTQGNNDVGV